MLNGKPKTKQNVTHRPTTHVKEEEHEYPFGKGFGHYQTQVDTASAATPVQLSLPHSAAASAPNQLPHSAATSASELPRQAPDQARQSHQVLDSAKAYETQIATLDNLQGIISCATELRN